MAHFTILYSCFTDFVVTVYLCPPIPPTWVKVCEGADDKVQRGNGQHRQQQQLESHNPLDTRQVDSKQRQQHHP